MGVDEPLLRMICETSHGDRAASKAGLRHEEQGPSLCSGGWHSEPHDRPPSTAKGPGQEEDAAVLGYR